MSCTKFASIYLPLHTTMQKRELEDIGLTSEPSNKNVNEVPLEEKKKIESWLSQPLETLKILEISDIEIVNVNVINEGNVGTIGGENSSKSSSVADEKPKMNIEENQLKAKEESSGLQKEKEGMITDKNIKLKASDGQNAGLTQTPERTESSSMDFDKLREATKKENLNYIIVTKTTSTEQEFGETSSKREDKKSKIVFSSVCMAETIQAHKSIDEKDKGEEILATKDVCMPKETACPDHKTEEASESSDSAKYKLIGSLVTTPIEETSSAKAGLDFSGNLEETSSMACEVGSQEIVELNEKMKDVNMIKGDDVQSNKLQSSLGKEIEDLSSQKAGKLETSKEESETRMKNIVKESQNEEDNKSEILQIIATTGKHDENNKAKTDISFTDPKESIRGESENLTPTEALTMECKHEQVSVAAGDGNTLAEKQDKTETSKHEEHLEQSFMQKTEPAKENLGSSSNGVSEETETTAPDEYAETITNTEEQRPVGDPEEILGERRKEETIMGDNISKEEIPEETNLSKIDLDEKTRGAESKISNKNGNDLHIVHPSIEETVQVGSVSGDQVHEAFEVPEEEEKHLNETNEANKSPKSTILDDTFTEVAVNMEVSTAKSEMYNAEENINEKRCELNSEDNLRGEPKQKEKDPDTNFQKATGDNYEKSTIEEDVLVKYSTPLYGTGEEEYHDDQEEKNRPIGSKEASPELDSADRSHGMSDETKDITDQIIEEEVHKDPEIDGTEEDAEEEMNNEEHTVADRSPESTGNNTTKRSQENEMEAKKDQAEMGEELETIEGEGIQKQLLAEENRVQDQSTVSTGEELDTECPKEDAMMKKTSIEEFLEILQTADGCANIGIGIQATEEDGKAKDNFAAGDGEETKNKCSYVEGEGKEPDTVVPQAIEGVADQEIIKDQSTEEEICSEELPTKPVADETADEVTELDLTPRQSLQGTVLNNNTGMLKSEAAELLNPESEASPMTKTLEEDTKKCDDETDIAETVATDVIDRGEGQLNDKRIKALNSSSDAKSLEITKTADPSQLGAGVDGMKLEENSTLLSQLPINEHEKEDNEHTTVGKSDANDAEAKETKIHGVISKSKDQGDREVHETDTSLTMGEADRKGSEIHISEVPEVASISYSVEGARDDEITAPPVATEITSLEEFKLNDEPVKASSDTGSLGTAKTADTSQQDIQLDSMKLEETSSMVSQFPKHENMENDNERITVEKSDVNDVELKKTNTPDAAHAPEKKDIKEFHETGTGLTIGGTDGNEIEKQIRQVPESLSEPINQGAEAARDDEITTGQTVCAKKIEEGPEVPSTALLSKEDSETTTTIRKTGERSTKEGNTKVDHLMFEEDSAIVSQQPITECESANNVTLENLYADEVKVKEINTSEEVSESKDHGFEKVHMVVELPSNVASQEIGTTAPNKYAEMITNIEEQRPVGSSENPEEKNLSKVDLDQKTRNAELEEEEIPEEKNLSKVDFDQKIRNAELEISNKNDNDFYVNHPPVEETVQLEAIEVSMSDVVDQIHEAFEVPEEGKKHVNETNEAIKTPDSTILSHKYTEGALNMEVTTTTEMDIKLEKNFELKSEEESKEINAEENMKEEIEQKEKASNIDFHIATSDDSEKSTISSGAEEYHLDQEYKSRPNSSKEASPKLNCRDQSCKTSNETENNSDQIKNEEVKDVEAASDDKVTSLGQFKLNDKPVNAFDYSSDAKSIETTEISETSQQDIEVENMKLEETSSTVSQFPIHENLENDNEGMIVEKSHANDVEVEEINNPVAAPEFENQAVQEFHEASTSLTTGGTDTNGTDKHIRQVPDLLFEPINQDVEPHANDVEVEEINIPDAAPESENQAVQEFHKGATSLTMGDTDTNETEKHIRQVPYFLSEPIYQDVEAAKDDEITHGQTPQTEKIEQLQVPSPNLLAEEKDSETTIPVKEREDGSTKKDETEVGSLMLDENSGIRYQLPMTECDISNNVVVEQPDAEEVAIKETKILDTISESKSQGLKEIHMMDLVSPSNVESDEIGTIAPSQYVEKTTNIKEDEHVGSTETVTTDVINKETAEEKNLSKVDLDEMKIPNENVNYLNVNHPPIEETVQLGGENQDQVSLSESGAHEAFEINKAEEKHVTETYEASKSKESTILEHASTEGKLAMEVTSTSKMDVKLEKDCEVNSEDKLKEINGEENIKEETGERENTSDTDLQITIKFEALKDEKNLDGKAETLVAKKTEEDITEDKDDSTNPEKDTNVEPTVIENEHINDNVWDEEGQEFYARCELKNDKGISESDVELLKGRKSNEIANSSVVGKLKTSEEEKSSDVELEKEKHEYVKAADESSNGVEECGKYTDTTSEAILELEDSMNSDGSSKESIEIERVPVEFEEKVHSHGSEASRNTSISTPTGTNIKTVEHSEKLRSFPKFVTEEKSRRRFPLSDQTSNEKESCDDVNQITDPTKEEISGKDIREGKKTMNKEMEPELKTNEELNEIKDTILMAEVLTEIERAVETEITEEQTTEESHVIPVADETINEVANRDLTPIQNLEATVSSINTEKVKSNVAKDLNQESEASPITKALEEETEKPADVSSSLAEVIEENIMEDNIEDAQNFDEADTASTMDIILTNTGGAQLNDQTVKALDTISDAPSLARTKTVDPCQQDAEVDSMKVKEISSMISQLPAQEHEKADDAEAKETKIPEEISKYKDRGEKEIHETDAGLSVGGVDTNENDKQIIEVREVLSESMGETDTKETEKQIRQLEPINQDVESVRDDEITPSQTLQTKKIEEQLQVPSHNLLSKGDSETTTTIEETEYGSSRDDTKVGNLMLEENSGILYQLPITECDGANNVIVENSDEVAVKETKTLDTQSESKGQGFKETHIVDLVSPTNVGSEEIETASPRDHVEMTTNIEEKGHVGSPETVMTDDINKDSQEEKNLSKLSLEEMTRSADVEIPNNGNDLCVTHPPVEETVQLGGENQDEVSASKLGDHETFGVTKENEKHDTETYEAKSPKSTTLEHMSTEGAIAMEVTSASEMDIKLEKGCKVNLEEELKEINSEKHIQEESEQKEKASTEFQIAMKSDDNEKSTIQDDVLVIDSNPSRTREEEYYHDQEDQNRPNSSKDASPELASEDQSCTTSNDAKNTNDKIRNKETIQVYKDPKISDIGEDLIEAKEIKHNKHSVTDHSPESTGKHTTECSQQNETEAKKHKAEMGELETSEAEDTNKQVTSEGNRVPKWSTVSPGEELNTESFTKDAIMKKKSKEEVLEILQIGEKSVNIGMQTKEEDGMAKNNFEACSEETKKECSYDKEKKDREPTTVVLETNHGDQGAAEQIIMNSVRYQSTELFVEKSVQESSHDDKASEGCRTAVKSMTMEESAITDLYLSSVGKEKLEETIKEEKRDSIISENEVKNSNKCMEQTFDATCSTEERSLKDEAETNEGLNTQNVTGSSKEETARKDRNLDHVEKSKLVSKISKKEIKEEILEKADSKVTVVAEETRLTPGEAEYVTQIDSFNLVSEEKGSVTTETSETGSNGKDTAAEPKETSSLGENDMKIQTAEKHGTDEASEKAEFEGRNETFHTLSKTDNQKEQNFGTVETSMDDISEQNLQASSWEERNFITPEASEMISDAPKNDKKLYGKAGHEKADNESIIVTAVPKSEDQGENEIQETSKALSMGNTATTQSSEIENQIIKIPEALSKPINQGVEAARDDETMPVQTLQAQKIEEQFQVPPSAMLSTEQDSETISAIVKTEDESRKRHDTKVDSLKPEENFDMVSQLPKIKCESANIVNVERSDADEVEVKESKTLDTITEPKDQDFEEIHEPKTSPTIENSEIEKIGGEIKGVNERKSDPIYQRVDTVADCKTPDHEESVASKEQQLQNIHLTVPPATDAAAEETPNEKVYENFEEASNTAPKGPTHGSMETNEENKEISSTEINYSESFMDNEKLESASEESGVKEDLDLKRQEIRSNKQSISSCRATTQEKITDKSQLVYLSNKQTTDAGSMLEEAKSIQFEEKHAKDEEPVELSTMGNERKLDEAKIHVTNTENEGAETQHEKGRSNVLSRDKEFGLEVPREKGIMDLSKMNELAKDTQELEKASLAISHEQKAYPSESTETTNPTASKYASGFEAEENGVKCGEEKTMDEESEETTKKSVEIETSKISLSDLLQRSTKQTLQVAEHLIEETELTSKKEEGQTGVAETVEVEEAKTDEEEGDEHIKVDLGFDAPAIVEPSRETDIKIAHKKPHNILSGVGSKVKHSLAKVKKAITGKSPHEKPSSPK